MLFGEVPELYFPFIDVEFSTDTHECSYKSKIVSGYFSFTYSDQIFNSPSLQSESIFQGVISTLPDKNRMSYKLFVNIITD